MSNKILESDDVLRRRIEKRYEARRDFLIHGVVYLAVVGGMWLLWLMNNAEEFWPLATTLLWGAGLAAHGIDVFYNSGRPAIELDQAVRREMRALYGDNWRVDATEDEYKDVRKRLKERYDKHKEVLSHAAVYVLVNLFVWNIFLANGGSGFPWPLLVSGGWGLGLFGHVAEVFMTGNRTAAVERALERERERLAEEAAMSEKRKRDEVEDEDAYNYVELSDDGELINLVEREAELLAKRKRQ